MSVSEDSRRRAIAIHPRPGGFSDRWIASCRERGIPHEIVDCHRSDAIDQLRGKSALLWHFGHGSAQDQLIARHVLKSAASMGLVTFPDDATCWHFDDKIAQKYALEAIGAPLVPTWVFLDARSAREFLETTTYPKVFKLRRGSGSRNVRLLADLEEARKTLDKAFGAGFTPSGSLRNEAWKFANSWRIGRFKELIQSLPAKIKRRRELDQRLGKESGYLYLQEFVPDNAFDTRITVIGKRAFGFTRGVRPGDFRASGSGRIEYDRSRIREAAVQTAFDVAQSLGAASICFDFVDDKTSQPRIVEISYGYESVPVHDCPGHWTPDLEWIEGHTWPEDAILDDVLERIEARAE